METPHQGLSPTCLPEKSGFPHPENRTYYQMQPEDMIFPEVLNEVYPSNKRNPPSVEAIQEMLAGFYPEEQHGGKEKEYHANQMRQRQIDKTSQIIKNYKHPTHRQQMLQAVQDAWINLKSPYYVLGVSSNFPEQLVKDAKIFLGKTETSLSAKHSKALCKRFLNILKEIKVLVYAQHFQKFTSWDQNDKAKQEEAQQFVRAATYCLHGFNGLHKSPEVQLVKGRIAHHALNLKMEVPNQPQPIPLAQQARNFFNKDPFSPLMNACQQQKDYQLRLEEVRLMTNPSDFFTAFGSSPKTLASSVPRHPSSTKASHSMEGKQPASMDKPRKERSDDRSRHRRARSPSPDNHRRHDAHRRSKDHRRSEYSRSRSRSPEDRRRSGYHDQSPRVHRRDERDQQRTKIRKNEDQYES